MASDKQKEQTFTHIRVGGYNPQAIAFAAKIDGKIIDDLDTIFEADLIKKAGKAVIRDDIVSIFQKKERDTMPRLDSGRVYGGEGVGWVVDRSTNNPDWTQVLDGKRTKWVSYFDTMVMRSPKGMAMVGEVENLKAQAKASEKPMTASDLLNKAETIEAQFKNWCLNFRGAMELLQTEDRAADMYPELSFNYRRGKDKSINVSVKYPIQAYDSAYPGGVENFTLSQFMGLEFEKVKTFVDQYKEGVENGTINELSKADLGNARWQVLLATKKREPETVEEDADNVDISNAVRFETASASMLHWLRNEQNVTRLSARFTNAKDIGNNAAYIETIVNLSIELNAIASELKKPRKGGKGSLYEQALSYSPDEEGATTESDSEESEAAA